MKEGQIFDKYLSLKEKYSIDFYDVHTNPADVFSLSKKGEKELESVGTPKKKFSGPSLLEKLDYSPLALRILGFLFTFFPKYMSNEVTSRYLDADENTFLSSFDEAGIDKAIALPALSSNTPLDIYKDFTSNRFVRLGTIDISSVRTEEIEKSLMTQVNDLKIRGLKFNPNIQKFYPEPSRNSSEISIKLEKIYDFASKNDLFLLIHGGVSYAPCENNPSKFEYLQYGEIQNFFTADKEGGALLSDTSPKLIIAHLGHYNSLKIRFDLLEKIITNYRHVYFDSCGVSSKLIVKFISKFGVSRLLFGSDMPYFNTRYAVTTMLKLLWEKNEELFEESVLKVFSTNFTDKILK